MKLSKLPFSADGFSGLRQARHGAVMDARDLKLFDALLFGSPPAVTEAFQKAAGIFAKACPNNVVTPEAFKVLAHLWKAHKNSTPDVIVAEAAQAAEKLVGKSPALQDQLTDALPHQPPTLMAEQPTPPALRFDDARFNAIFKMHLARALK